MNILDKAKELGDKAQPVVEKALERAKDMTGLGGKAQLVLPRTDGGWEVRVRGADRATETFERKVEAVDRATELARKQQAELVIFKVDGDIDRRADFSA